LNLWQVAHTPIERINCRLSPIDKIVLKLTEDNRPSYVATGNPLAE
jgi:hypothetical protein